MLAVYAGLSMYRCIHMLYIYTYIYIYKIKFQYTWFATYFAWFWFVIGADGERFAGHSFPWAFPGFEKVGLAMLQVIDGEQSKRQIAWSVVTRIYASPKSCFHISGAGQTWSCVALVAVLENERPFAPLTQLTQL